MPAVRYLPVPPPHLLLFLSRTEEREHFPDIKVSIDVKEGNEVYRFIYENPKLPIAK